MKNVKRLTSLLLVMVMVFAMSVTAFAAGNGNITIKNAPKNTTYTIYRIFDLESFNDSDADGIDPEDAYAYKITAEWTGFFTEGAEGAAYVDVTNGYVTWKKDADAKSFAEKALKYAKDNSVAYVSNHTTTTDNETVNFEELELGHYLINSSHGIMCSLTTTNPDATVIEKNSSVNTDKKVKENGEWKDKNDASIGDVVEFMATITVQGYAAGYVMHDKMSEGLTFDATSVKVEKNATEVTSTGNYEVVTTGIEDECTFEVKFSEAFCKDLKSGDVINVYYSAKLNEKAIIYEPDATSNTNEMKLEYKDNNGETHTTTPDTTDTYTYEIPVLKYINGDKNKYLAGAGFKLYKTKTETENSVDYSNPVTVSKVDGKNEYKVNPTATTEEIITDSTGRFEIEGLDAGTYYLKETTTPAGYNKLDKVITIVIDHDGTITADNTTVTEVAVENKTGTILPSTGGIGTTMFYVTGTVLALGAAVVLVAKKRTNREF